MVGKKYKIIKISHMIQISRTSVQNEKYIHIFLSLIHSVLQGLHTQILACEVCG